MGRESALPSSYHLCDLLARLNHTIWRQEGKEGIACLLWNCCWQVVLKGQLLDHRPQRRSGSTGRDQTEEAASLTFTLAKEELLLGKWERRCHEAAPSHLDPGSSPPPCGRSPPPPCCRDGFPLRCEAKASPWLGKMTEERLFPSSRWRLLALLSELGVKEGAGMAT